MRRTRHVDDDSEEARVAPALRPWALLALLLFVALLGVPYFDYERYLPPEPAHVQLSCRLLSLETQAFRLAEARVSVEHWARVSGEWETELLLLVPSALLRRHMRCQHEWTGVEDGEREYVYHRLYPNISGSLDPLVTQLRARYAQPLALWNYGETPANSFREYALDEHQLSERPLDRWEDAWTIYFVIRGLQLQAALLLTVCLYHARQAWRRWLASTAR